MPAGVYPRKKRIPNCHPEREHSGDGLCKKCWQKRYCTSDEGRTVRRNRMLLDLYGISLEEYEKLYAAQNGICCVCKKTFKKFGKDGLCVDHDHVTGQVRGLLCIRCNTHLGWYEANRKEIETYIEETNKEQISGSEVRQEQTEPIIDRPLCIEATS